MTPEEIDAMPAGPEMDAMVAERVFGKKTIRDYFGRYYVPHSDPPKFFDNDPVPPYSTDDAAALEVLSFLRNRFRFRLDWLEMDQWDVYFLEKAYLTVGGWNIRFRSTAQTLALAICRAALKASL